MKDNNNKHDVKAQNFNANKMVPVELDFIPLKEFHKFPTFVIELRFKIWETAASEPRIIELRGDHGDSDLDMRPVELSFASSGLLLANKESRAKYLESHVPLLPRMVLHNKISPITYFNPKQDILYFAMLFQFCYECPECIAPLKVLAKMEHMNNVRYVAWQTMDVAEFMAKQVISMFPTIEIVYSIVNSNHLNGVDEMGWHTPAVPGEISFHEVDTGEKLSVKSTRLAAVDINGTDEGASNVLPPVVIEKRMSRGGLFCRGTMKSA